MSRIRSVHPGLFTDEAFVCLSDAAQIFLIGLWTECDDQGAFEWKPVQLRLKIRGNRDGSIEPILEELEAANCIRSYEHGGRKYGLVRNFQRFQRPKKPNSVHFIPPELRTYVGSSGVISPPVTHQLPTSGEKSPQMEDGGGRREDEGGERARAQEFPHGQEVGEILESRAAALDAWEQDFLISIRWKSKLSKSQAESLAAIRAKLASKSGVETELWQVRKGSAEHDAWLAHFRKRGSAKFYESREVITVPAQWPPAEAAA